MIDAPAASREKVEARDFPIRHGVAHALAGPVEVLTVRVGSTGFDDWWEPFTLGVGPAGNYVAGLGPAANGRPEGEPRQPFAAGPFEITVCAWTVIGRFDRASRSAFDSNS